MGDSSEARILAIADPGISRGDGVGVASVIIFSILSARLFEVIFTSRLCNKVCPFAITLDLVHLGMDELDKLLSQSLASGSDSAGDSDSDTRVLVIFAPEVSAAYPRASDLEDALRMMFEDEDAELMDRLVWDYGDKAGVQCYAPNSEIAARVGEVAAMSATLAPDDDPFDEKTI